MPASIRVSGVYKAISKIYVRVAGVWKEVQNAYVRAGGVWKQFHAGVTITLPATDDVFDQRFGEFPAQAGWSLQSNGDITHSDSHVGTTIVGQWLNPQQDMGLYDVRATLSIGGPLAFGSSATGVWLSLGASRLWLVSREPSEPGETIANLLIEIRRNATGVVLDDCSLVLSVQQGSIN